MQALANWWDQFAAYEVSDLPRVNGGEATAAAEHVADALRRWRDAAHGPALRTWCSGANTWKDSARRRRSAGWSPPSSIVATARPRWACSSPGSANRPAYHWKTRITRSTSAGRRWAEDICSDDDAADRPKTLRRFFEALEANAEDFWHVPSLAGGPAGEDGDERL